MNDELKFVLIGIAVLTAIQISRNWSACSQVSQWVSSASPLTTGTTGNPLNPPSGGPQGQYVTVNQTPAINCLLFRGIPGYGAL